MEISVIKEMWYMCQYSLYLRNGADDLCESWLKNLASVKVKAKEEGGTQDTIYQTTILRERQMEAGRRLYYVLGNA